MDSPALRIAQRFAFSAFAAAVLGELYVPGSGCHRKVAARVLGAFRVDDAVSSPCECGRCIPRAPMQSRQSAPSRKATAKRFNEETFRDCWRMRQRATAPTYKLMQSVGVGPAALWRLHRVEDMPHRLLPCEYFATLMSALVALQLTDKKDHKRDQLKEKRERARGVLDTVLARWKPDGKGMVKLPSLPLPRTKSFFMAAGVARGRDPTTADVANEFVAMQSAPHAFKVGRDYRREWSKTKHPKLDEAVVFLLKIPTDDKSCDAFPAASLRWALDLAAAVAASQALAMFDLRTERGTVDKTTRRSVELFTPLWRTLWGAPLADLDPLPLVPAFLDSLFPLPPGQSPRISEALRVQAAMQTLASSSDLAQMVMMYHGVAPRELQKAWDAGLKSISVPALPNAGAGRRQRSFFFEPEPALDSAQPSPPEVSRCTDESEQELLSEDGSDPHDEEVLDRAVSNWVEGWRLPFLKRLQRLATVDLAQYASELEAEALAMSTSSSDAPSTLPTGADTASSP